MADLDNTYGGYDNIRSLGESRPWLPHTEKLLSGKKLTAFEEGQALARLRSRDLLRKSEALAREKGWRG
jgi:hypothetical protein